MNQQLEEITSTVRESCIVCPKVSVIVPVYNQVRYVEQTLDSVLACLYPNLELIIIDDASSDGSQLVVHAWCQNHPSCAVTFIEHLSNKGVCKTLNEAIGHARGDYICLLAADDLLLPNGIIDRVRYLEQHPEKLAVFADCRVIDANGDLRYESGIEQLYEQAGMRKNQLAIDELIPSSIVFNWAVPGPVFMCRRDTYNIVGSYDESLIVEDWDMYLRIAAEGKLGFIPEVVAEYRTHSANMCSTRQERIAMDMHSVAKKHIRRFRGANALYLRFTIKHYEYIHSTSSLSRFVLRLQCRFFFHASKYLYRFGRKITVLRRCQRFTLPKESLGCK
jgi:glycosyltransferase involved in cell wall biosynthesis